MEVLWNQINLQRPPFRSWDVSIHEFDPKQFIETIDKILEEFQSFKILHPEAALLSRLIYRMKSKFRNDKGLKYMEKVNRALLNYLNMSIEREFELLKEYVEINNGIASFPPQQNLEYVLVKLQGFAKLMCRVESTAMMAGQILQSRFHTGQSWSVAIIAYGVISRIWILSRQMVKKICKWYKKIHHFIKYFKPVGISWLPEDYHLPLDLSKWLQLTWLSEDIKKLPLKSKLGKSIFNLIETVDEIEDNNLDENKVELEKLTADYKKTKAKQNKNINQEDDLGKCISRLDFEKSIEQKELTQTVRKKKIKKNKKERQKTELLVHSEKDVVNLLQTDSISGFDKLQWNQIKKRVKKLLMKLTKNNTCSLNEKKFIKINSKLKIWTQSV